MGSGCIESRRYAIHHIKGYVSRWITLRCDSKQQLGAVDTEELDKLIEQCLHEERPHALLTLQLDSCGMYVASRLRNYERALAEHGKAKAAKKRADAYFSPSWTAFQADRGRRFNVIVDGISN